MELQGKGGGNEREDWTLLDKDKNEGVGKIEKSNIMYSENCK